MKLNARDVAGFLKQPTRVKAALIYGPDRGQIRQYADTIAAAILADIADPFNRADIEGDALSEDPSRLLEEVSAISFTGDTRYIMLRDAKDSAFATVEEALSLLTPQTYLVITADNLTPRSKLRQLFEKQSNVASIACYQEEGVALEQLIKQTLSGYGLKPESGVVSYLSEHLGGDRMVVLNELEKLSLYAMDEESLSLETVQHVCDSSGELTLDQIAKAVASRDVALMTKHMQRARQEGLTEIAVLRAVMRYFNRLAAFHNAIAQGSSAEQVVKSSRPPVFYKDVPIVISHIKKWTLRSCERVCTMSHETERRIKKGLDQPFLYCEHMLLEMCGLPLNRRAA